MAGRGERVVVERHVPGRWLIVSGLIGVAGVLAGALLAPQAGAQVGAGGTSDGGVFAIAGQITRDTYGLYLVDPRQGTICVYQYISAKRTLRLLAARTFVYDRQLDSYNTEPKPADIAKMVAEARRLRTATTKAAP